jgi:hypothetical protein
LHEAPEEQPFPLKYNLQPSFFIENQLFKERERRKGWSKSKEEVSAGENKGENRRMVESQEESREGIAGENCWRELLERIAGENRGRKKGRYRKSEVREESQEESRNVKH